MSVKRKKVSRRIKSVELLFIAAAAMIVIAAIASASLNSMNSALNSQTNYSSALTKSSKSNRQEPADSAYSSRFSDFWVWQGQKDSNPRHAVLETAALPTELYP